MSPPWSCLWLAWTTASWGWALSWASPRWTSGCHEIRTCSLPAQSATERYKSVKNKCNRVETREYLMYYWGLGFLVIVLFSSSPTPSPSIYLAGDTEDRERETTCQREGWGGAKSNAGCKALSSVINKILSCWERVSEVTACPICETASVSDLNDH